MSQVRFVGTYKERMKKAVIEILSVSGVDNDALNLYRGIIDKMIDEKSELETKTMFQRLQLIFSEPKIKENPLL